MESEDIFIPNTINSDEESTDFHKFSSKCTLALGFSHSSMQFEVETLVPQTCS